MLVITLVVPLEYLANYSDDNIPYTIEYLAHYANDNSHYTIDYLANYGDDNTPQYHWIFSQLSWW